MNESDIEGMIKSRLKLLPVHNTRFIDIRTFGDNPEEAADLANAMAEAYRDYWAEENEQNANGEIKKIVSIFDRAVLNPIPVRSNRPGNVIIGAILGIMAGLAAGTLAAGFITIVRKSRTPPLIRRTVDAPISPARRP